MKSLFASSAIGLWGLLFFLGLFVGILIWLFRPGAKKKYEEHSKIPLEDDQDEQ